MFFQTSIQTLCEKLEVGPPIIRLEEACFMLCSWQRPLPLEALARPEAEPKRSLK